MRAGTVTEHKLSGTTPHLPALARPCLKSNLYIVELPRTANFWQAKGNLRHTAHEFRVTLALALWLICTPRRRRRTQLHHMSGTLRFPPEAKDGRCVKRLGGSGWNARMRCESRKRLPSIDFVSRLRGPRDTVSDWIPLYRKRSASVISQKSDKSRDTARGTKS